MSTRVTIASASIGVDLSSYNVTNSFETGYRFAAVGGDYGLPRGHRFNGRVAESFPVGGHDEKVNPAKKFGDILPETGKVCMPVQISAPQESLHCGAQVSLPCQNELRIPVPLDKEGHRLKERHQPFLLVQPSDEHGERKSRAGILIPATAQMGKRLSWAEVAAEWEAGKETAETRATVRVLLDLPEVASAGQKLPGVIGKRCR